MSAARNTTRPTEKRTTSSLIDRGFFRSRHDDEGGDESRTPVAMIRGTPGGRGIKSTGADSWSLGTTPERICARRLDRGVVVAEGIVPGGDFRAAPMPIPMSTRRAVFQAQ